MSLVTEFKQFAMRGNVIDLAVGVVIGGAFGKIVDSLVKDVIMPPIGLLTGGVDFGNLYLDLSGKTYTSLKAAQDAGAPTINYGLFINVVIQFLIVAFAIFMVIKMMNRLRRAEAPAPAPTTKKCPECFSEIPIPAKRCAHCTSPVAV